MQVISIMTKTLGLEISKSPSQSKHTPGSHALLTSTASKASLLRSLNSTPSLSAPPLSSLVFAGHGDDCSCSLK
jgi:hypothetical protein